jgi:Rhodopirellula transposase DDE domain
MLGYILANWRAAPLDRITECSATSWPTGGPRLLTDLRTIIELIAGTTTKTGLKIYAEANLDFYPTGVEVTDAELTALPINSHDDWAS